MSFISNLKEYYEPRVSPLRSCRARGPVPARPASASGQDPRSSRAHTFTRRVFVGCGRAPSHGKSSTESLNSHWRLRPGTAGCGLNSPCADRSANGEDSGARSQLAGEGVRANGSRLRGTEGEEEEESIIAPAAAPASASSSTARRSRRQGADFACDPIMIAVIASSTAPRLPASLQDLGSSPKEAKKQAGPPLYHKRI